MDENALRATSHHFTVVLAEIKGCVAQIRAGMVRDLSRNAGADELLTARFEVQARSVGNWSISEQRFPVGTQVQPNGLQLDHWRTWRLPQVDRVVEILPQVVFQLLPHLVEIDRVTTRGDFQITFVPPCEINERQPA